MEKKYVQYNSRRREISRTIKPKRVVNSEIRLSTKVADYKSKILNIQSLFTNLTAAKDTILKLESEKAVNYIKQMGSINLANI